MKKTTKIIIILLISIIPMFHIPTNKQVFASSSSSEIVMEVNSKRVLYEKNAQEKKYMASTTKILTAIIIIENCDLSKIVTVSSKTVGIEGSSIYLKAGERITVKDLLYGLMLRSGNDCAETLAVHCSGSIKDFANLMNEKAKEIGAINSNFVNPHGLHDDNHYTTAYDLALISCYAIKNPTFKEIVSTKSTKITFLESNYVRHIANKNKMLKEFDGATGIKTGFTKKAGRCLVSSCERDGLEIVSVVLNCPPMFEESKNILNNAFSSFKLYKLFESDNIIDFIIEEVSNREVGIYVKNDIILPLLEEEFKNIEINYNYSKKVNFLLKNDQEIGTIEIYCKNNLLFVEKIYTIL